jgi:hypothetical protein
MCVFRWMRITADMEAITLQRALLNTQNVYVACVVQEANGGGE